MAETLTMRGSNSSDYANQMGINTNFREVKEVFSRNTSSFNQELGNLEGKPKDISSEVLLFLSSSYLNFSEILKEAGSSLQETISALSLVALFGPSTSEATADTAEFLANRFEENEADSRMESGVGARKILELIDNAKKIMRLCEEKILKLKIKKESTKRAMTTSNKTAKANNVLIQSNAEKSVEFFNGEEKTTEFELTFLTKAKLDISFMLSTLFRSLNRVSSMNNFELNPEPTLG